MKTALTTCISIVILGIAGNASVSMEISSPSSQISPLEGTISRNIESKLTKNERHILVLDKIDSINLSSEVTKNLFESRDLVKNPSTLERENSGNPITYSSAKITLFEF